MELCFEGRSNIIRTWGKLRPCRAIPEILPEPVMTGSTPLDARGVQLYGTILREGDGFRMWYQAHPQGFATMSSPYVAVAESDDGIVWRKPPLNLVEFNGDKKNNLCSLGLHCPTVFIDPDAPASHRYRASGSRKQFLEGASRRSGYYTSHSADGLNWTLDDPEPRWPWEDVINSVYHPIRRCGLTALKRTHRVNGVVRRSIWESEYRDGDWGEPRSVLVPDSYDDIRAQAHGYAIGDYYGMGMMPAGQGMVGFPWHFRYGGPAGFGSVDLGLTFQENPGGGWMHYPGRPDFISHDLVPWAPGGIYSASSAIEVGDEQWLYFAGAGIRHGWRLNSDWQGFLARDPEPQACVWNIGLARWPRNRLFGLEADSEGLLWLDLGEISEPCELWLNYRTAPSGQIGVRLADWGPLYAEADISGRDAAAVVPLRGDKLETVVSWKDGSVIQPLEPERHLTAYIELDRATLYGYELRPARS